ncbi:hypothetical protein ACFE04_030586 [Oxalis oulophora]
MESSSTKVSPPPSPTMPKINHAHTRIVPTKWAKVGFPKLSSFTLIGIGLETIANHIIPFVLAPSPSGRAWEIGGPSRLWSDLLPGKGKVAQLDAYLGDGGGRPSNR